MRCDFCPACCAAHAQGQCPQDALVYNAPIVLYSGITLTFLHYIEVHNLSNILYLQHQSLLH